MMLRLMLFKPKSELDEHVDGHGDDEAATMMKKNEVEDAVEELRCCGAPVHEPKPHTPKNRP